jgi:hypothetical protein
MASTAVRKTLGQSAPLAATDTVLYTVPANTDVVLSGIVICETGGAHADYSCLLRCCGRNNDRRWQGDRMGTAARRKQFRRRRAGHHACCGLDDHRPCKRGDGHVLGVRTGEQLMRVRADTGALAVLP